MELNRENQLKIIREGLKEMGITQHRLEILANIPVGTIKDCRRGKRAMTADKWQKISNILNPSKQTMQIKQPGQNPINFSETELGLLSAIKGIIAIFSDYDVLQQKDLGNIFSYQLRDFRMQAQPGAAQVMEQLIEFLNASSRVEKPQRTDKPLSLSQDQSKIAKSLET